MKTIFLLSGEHIELAKEEVLSLTENKDYELFDRLLILDTNEKNLDRRLAFTHKIYRFLFETNLLNLKKDMKNFDWNEIYKKDFSLRIIKDKSKNKILNEAKLADYIWRTVSKPKVNLINAKTRIEFIVKKNKVVCGLLLKEIKKDFLKRKAHMRPELHPTSLNPKLARACINLIRTENKLVDPFCGSGGILIEAGKMNLKAVGYDIDKIMLKRAKINLDYYKIKDYKLINKDARKIKNKIDFVVTDLPYGKNTKKTNLQRLYPDFLKNLKKILTKKAVIIFPDFIDYKKLIKKSKLKIEKEFSYYIHKSMTKKIVLLKV